MTIEATQDAQEELWEGRDVLRPIADAFRVLRATVGRVGHKRIAAAWPEYAIDLADINSREDGENKHRTKEPRVLPGARDIKRMEIVLVGGRGPDGSWRPAWLNGSLMAYPEQRKALISSCLAKSLRISDRQLCRMRGWERMQFRRARDAGADIVAVDLNRLGLKRW